MAAIKVGHLLDDVITPATWAPEYRTLLARIEQRFGVADRGAVDAALMRETTS